MMWSTASTWPWGSDALADQRTAGAIMLTIEELAIVLAALLVALAWLKHQRVRRAVRGDTGKATSTDRYSPGANS